MRVYTPAEVVEAVKATMDGPFPLAENIETVSLLAQAIEPVMSELPPHHDCEVVRLALETMFVMGLAAGAALEREP